MPNEVSRTNRATDSFATYTPDIIYSIFSGSESGTTAMLKSGRAVVGLKDSHSFKDTLINTESGIFQRSAAASISTIFYPYQSYWSGATEMPTFIPSASGSNDGSGYIFAKDILPIYWDNFDTDSVYDRMQYPSGDAMSNLISSEMHYGDIDRFRDHSNTRAIGLRLPMVGVGWGYTTDNMPFPSGTASSNKPKFKGDVAKGVMVDPKDYVAAPIDLRYDTNRNVWTAPNQGFWAKIISGSGAFKWVEQRLKQDGKFEDLPYGRSGKEGNVPAYEANQAGAIPSGTIVWMHDTDRKDARAFVYGGSSDGFWARISGYSSIVGQSGRYVYTAVRQKAGAAGQMTDDSDYSSLTLVYNTIECYNDGAGLEGNSANLTNYPSGTMVAPVQGNPVVWLRSDYDCYGNRIYYFQYENKMPEICIG